MPLEERIDSNSTIYFYVFDLMNSSKSLPNEFSFKTICAASEGIA